MAAAPASSLRSPLNNLGAFVQAVTEGDALPPLEGEFDSDDLANALLSAVNQRNAAACTALLSVDAPVTPSRLLGIAAEELAEWAERHSNAVHEAVAGARRCTWWRGVAVSMLALADTRDARQRLAGDPQPTRALDAVLPDVPAWAAAVVQAHMVCRELAAVVSYADLIGGIESPAVVRLVEALLAEADVHDLVETEGCLSVTTLFKVPAVLHVLRRCLERPPPWTAATATAALCGAFSNAAASLACVEHDSVIGLLSAGRDLGCLLDAVEAAAEWRDGLMEDMHDLTLEERTFVCWALIPPFVGAMNTLNSTTNLRCLVGAIAFGEAWQAPEIAAAAWRAGARLTAAEGARAATLRVAAAATMAVPAAATAAENAALRASLAHCREYMRELRSTLRLHAEIRASAGGAEMGAPTSMERVLSTIEAAVAALPPTRGGADAAATATATVHESLEAPRVSGVRMNPVHLDLSRAQELATGGAGGVADWRTTTDADSDGERLELPSAHADTLEDGFAEWQTEPLPAETSLLAEVDQ